MSNTISRISVYSNPQNKYQSNFQSKEVKNELGKEEFLKILVAQLRHQNPLEPMDDKEFIAQMAQFSSLEQLQNMNSFMSEMLFNQREMATSILITEALSYIGKEIEAIDPETEENITGIVDKVKLKEGIPYLLIGDSEVPAAFVQLVSNNLSNAQEEVIEENDNTWETKEQIEGDGEHD